MGHTLRSETSLEAFLAFNPHILFLNSEVSSLILLYQVGKISSSVLFKSYSLSQSVVIDKFIQRVFNIIFIYVYIFRFFYALYIIQRACIKFDNLILVDFYNCLRFVNISYVQLPCIGKTIQKQVIQAIILEIFQLYRVMQV